MYDEKTYGPQSCLDRALCYNLKLFCCSLSLRNLVILSRGWNLRKISTALLKV